MKNNEITIRRICEDEMPEALDLVWKVFNEFEAPEYSKEGIPKEQVARKEI